MGALLRAERQVRGDELPAALALERPALPLLGGHLAVRGGQVLIERLAVAAPAGEAGVAPGAVGARDQLHRYLLALHGALERARNDLVAADPSAIITPLAPDPRHPAHPARSDP